MKNFFVKGIVFSIIVGICIGICNWGYLKDNPFSTNKFKNMPDKIQLCNVGASHSKYSFNYEDYKDQYKTFNFGLDAQSHTYDYRILEYYKDKLNDDTIVFIVVSYPMIIGHDETEREDWESMNRRYYTFLPPKFIKDYDSQVDLKVSLVPFTYSVSARDLISKIIRTDIVDRWEKMWENNPTEEEIIKDAEDASLSHVVTDKRDENGKIIYLQEEIDAIYNMIDLCKKQGATPILLTPPFTMDYVTKIKERAPDYYKGFHDIIKQIQNDTKVEYYDYSEDERFTSDYSKFINADHLNKEAAKQFTKILMDEVVGNRIKK